jgi:hypothetical protein
MSRTINDTPYWVVANNSPRHFGEDHRCTSRFAAECDVDIPRTPEDKYRRCEYILDPTSSHYAVYNRRYWHRPRRDERHNSYWAPERAKTRNILNRAAREHRGGSDTDTTPGIEQLHDQHLHAPAGFGWWD